MHRFHVLKEHTLSLPKVSMRTIVCHVQQRKLAMMKQWTTMLPFKIVPKDSGASQAPKQDGLGLNVLATTVHAQLVSTVSQERKIQSLAQKAHSQTKLVLGQLISVCLAHQDGFVKPQLELVVSLHQVSLALPV